jgi:hypothetical protein
LGLEAAGVVASWLVRGLNADQTSAPFIPGSLARRAVQSDTILLKYFLFLMPLAFIAAVATANAGDVVLNVLGYKIALSLGWTIGIVAGLCYVYGLYCGWDSTRNGIRERIRAAKEAGKLDAVFTSPEATKQLETIVGSLTKVRSTLHS